MTLTTATVREVAGLSPDRREQSVPPMCVLVVDDEQMNRVLLRKLLERDGHSVVEAENGVEAVKAFERESPAMVLLDIMMPVMNGYEACKEIVKRSGGRFLPIIFLTALTDDDSLAHCIECGGDDFITKPINRVLLRAKIAALARVAQLYQTVERQRDEIHQHNERLQHEHEIAERMFTNMFGHDAFEVPNIRKLVSPMAIATGDVVLSAMTPAGQQRVMIGDFTGHGLAAAVGAIPVYDTFQAMTAKGLCLSEVMLEINRKLYEKLPTDIFLAACLMEVDFDKEELSVWNGGMPDVLVVDEKQGIRKRISSAHLPLGIVNSAAIDAAPEVCSMQPRDRIYLYSDGVIEAADEHGEMFGQHGLEQCIQSYRNGSDLFGRVCAALREFRGEQSQSDDLTMVEVVFDTDLLGEHDPVAPEEAVEQQWRFSLQLGPAALRQLDPLVLLQAIIAKDDELANHRTYLYTVLTELYTNALDHGVLDLNTQAKDSAEDFFAYHAVRDKSLADLASGWIELDIECATGPGRGEMVFRVADSGQGFTQGHAGTSLDDNTGPHGRGLALVKALCESVQVAAGGDGIRAVYRWSR